MSDWSHWTCAMPKQVRNLEAMLCLHLWRDARETALLLIEYAEACIQASHEAENAEIEARYRQQGLTVRARTVFAGPLDGEGATCVEFDESMAAARQKNAEMRKAEILWDGGA